jgi:DNA-binding transcriptional ArsR family regulator
MGDQDLVRDNRQPGHFWADNEIVDEYLQALGVYGFAVYMLLARYADSKTGQCDPSIAGMAAKLGISAPTVRAALDRLKDAKLITIRHRHRERDGKVINQTSIYTILAVKKAQTGAPTKPGLVPNDIDQGTKGDLPPTKPGLPGVLNQVSTNKTHENKTLITRGGEAPAHTPAVQAYFETYPNETLDADQIAEIDRTVVDLPRWLDVLRYWKMSRYRAQSVPKMVDRYASGATVANDRPGGNRPMAAAPHVPTYDLPTDTRTELTADQRRANYQTTSTPNSPPSDRC